MDTYKVTLTVVEPVEIVGFFEGETQEAVIAEMIPVINERWGEGNATITDIEPATDEEKEFIIAAMAEKNKGLN